MTMLLALITHGHLHVDSDERAKNARGWEEVCSRYDTPSVEHLRHYPYGSRRGSSYRSSSRGVSTDSLQRFID